MANKKYIPSESDFELALKLKNEKKTDREIADALQITYSMWRRNKKLFEHFFVVRGKGHLVKEGTGRPRTADGYDSKIHKKIVKLASYGLTDKQIADMVDIAVMTLNNWKKIYPDLHIEMKCAKQILDNKVMQKLVDKALGFSYEERSINEFTDAQGKVTSRQISRQKRYAQPSVTAARWWIHNRQGWSYGGEQKQTDDSKNKGKILDFLDNIADDTNELNNESISETKDFLP